MQIPLFIIQNNLLLSKKSYRHIEALTQIFRRAIAAREFGLNLM